MDTHWIELFGKLSLLVGSEDAIHVQDKSILTPVPDKYELAVFSAAPIARRIWTMCEAAQSNNLPIVSTVSEMLADESRPLVLRLGFDDLTPAEHKVLSKQPHAPFLHLAPQILLVLGGLIQMPEYLSHLEQIPSTATLVFDKSTLGQIAVGMVPNINILPTGGANHVI